MILAGAVALGAWAAKPSRMSAADYLDQARRMAAEYRPADAREALDNYERLQKRARKAVPESVEAERAALVEMENMLERVEKIEIIDSLCVDSAAFFTYYKLSPEAGRIVRGATVRIPEAPMAFIPQSAAEIIYPLPDSAGRYELQGADILDDGTLDHPAPLGVDTGDAESRFPFLMPDGVTLYYAHNGTGGLGGYDIYLTRRSEDGWLQPQNVGMPYNSPANDYLLAIDEATGAGWWATDRNNIPGKVTVYVFKPSETRINVDPDSPDLIALARLSDISLTHEPGADYSDILGRIENNGTPRTAEAAQSDFEIYVGEKIYRKLSDFRDADARRAMGRAINARSAIASAQQRLADLRERYRRGDKSLDTEILNLEARLDDDRITYREAVNEAIAAETGER